MPVVGIAEVTVEPTFDGVQRTIAAEMNTAADRAGRSAGPRLGSTMAAGMGRALKFGAVAAGAAVAGVLSTAVVKGFNRLSAIENATAKLTGLGNSARDVKTIMDDALKSVKGTAFGMDEAATTAASAVAAGIKPGKELQRYLGLVGDAATIAGTDMKSMGAIFNKVATSGKAQGDVFAQLGDQGIPIVTLLAQRLGKTAGEIYDMGAAGEITSAQFLDAMSSMQGAALKSGNTTSGAFKNAGAALSRFGAALLGGVYPLAGKLFNVVTKGLDLATAKVAPLATAVGETLVRGFDRAAAAWAAFQAGAFTGDIVRKMGLDPATGLGFALNEALGGIRAFGAAWKKNDGDITSSGFPGFMERAAAALRQTWEGLRRLDFSSLEGFFASLRSAGSPIGDLLASMGNSMQRLTPAFGMFLRQLPSLAASGGTLAVGGLTLLAGVLGFLADNVETIIRFMPLIVAGFVAWRVASMGLLFAQQRLLLVSNLMAPVFLANNVLRLTNNIIEAQATKTMTASAVASGQLTAKMTTQGIATAALSAVTGAYAGVAAAAGVASGALGAGLKVVAVGMKATGIGLLIAGVAAALGGLVYWLIESKDAQTAVGGLFGFIADTVGGIVTWFQATILPGLQQAAATIGDGFRAAADGITGAWTWVQDVVGGVASWWDQVATGIRVTAETVGAGFAALAGWVKTQFVDPVVGLFRQVGQTIAALYSVYLAPIVAPVMVVLNGFRELIVFLGQLLVATVVNVIIPAIGQFAGWVGQKFVEIGATIGSWWATASALFTLAVGFVRSVVGGAFTWLRDTVGGVFGAIALAAVAWWTQVSAQFNLAVAFVRSVLAVAFTWLRDSVITPVFTTIQTVIGAVWAWVRDQVFTPIVGFVRGPLTAGFVWFRDGVITPVWNTIRAVISGAWTWIRDQVFAPVVSWVRATLGPAFIWLRDTAAQSWNGLKVAVSTVWNWVRDNVFSPMWTFLTKTIPNAVNTGVESVKRFFNDLKKAAAVPVNWVINTVINGGIIDTFEKIANTVDPGRKIITQRLSRLPLIGGFDAGGWTGPGSKYTPAGVVHADEFVIRKESQNSIRRAAPGFLDALNRYGARALSTAAGYATGGRVKPLARMALTQGYSGRGGHDAWDLVAPMGTPVYAPEGGLVSWASAGVASNGVWGGNEVHLNVPGGLQLWFAHLNDFAVKLNDMVKGGQLLGHSGNTGISSGPHLHFGVYRGGWPNSMDPASYLGSMPSDGPINGPGGFDPVAPLRGIIDGIAGQIRGAFPAGGRIVDSAAAGAKNLGTGVADWLGQKVQSFLGMDENGAGVRIATGLNAARNFLSSAAIKARWGLTMTDALNRTGQFSPQNLGLGLSRLEQESNGDPNVVNTWDVNAQRGDPSVGLMQVIGSTFARYRDRSLPDNVRDPLANIVASIRYTIARYGSLAAGWGRQGGYADGGLVQPYLYDQGGVLPPGLSQVVNLTRQPEHIYTRSQSEALQNLAARGAERQPVYVQNPFTGEYLLARVDDRVGAGMGEQARDLRVRRVGR